LSLIYVFYKLTIFFSAFIYFIFGISHEISLRASNWLIRFS